VIAKITREIPRSRKSSSPYISGDSFLHLADYALLLHQHSVQTRKKLERILISCQNQRVILFVEVSFLEVDENIGIFNNWVSRNSELLRKNCTLILHNGDKLPKGKELLHFSGSFSRIFAVNSLDADSVIKPLPIGLENRHHNRNGVGREFHLNSECVFTVNPPMTQNSSILGSFAVGTNQLERGKLKELMDEFDIKFINPQLKPRDYRILVSNHQFVLSPPGNGFDCHRTWEAMYLGAIPVVLKDCLHPQLISNFPIYAVNKWEDILEKKDYELGEIASEFSGRRYPALAMEFWDQLIRTGS
jgi:hypothetical protein